MKRSRLSSIDDFSETCKKGRFIGYMAMGDIDKTRRDVEVALS
jgi:hypothetical protein